MILSSQFKIPWIAVPSEVAFEEILLSEVMKVMLQWWNGRSMFFQEHTLNLLDRKLTQAKASEHCMMLA